MRPLCILVFAALLAACPREVTAERYLLFSEHGVLAFGSKAACDERRPGEYWIVSETILSPGRALIGGELVTSRAPCGRWRLFLDHAEGNAESNALVVKTKRAQPLDGAGSTGGAAP